MVLLDDCRTRLRGALELLHRIGVAKDPQIRAGFQYLKNELRRIDGEIQSTNEELSFAQLQLLQSNQGSLHRISIYAGRLLRASNARNAFEWFAPFASLFRKVVNGSDFPDDLLVFSSEWHYNLEVTWFPLQTGESAEPSLRHFAWFIGYPAFESENPHVLPVVGHEIGHAFWHRRECEQIFTPKVSHSIEKQFGKKAVTEKELWVRKNVIRQVEELFCDTVAALLFGPAFLYAFRYLLAPSGLGAGKRQNAGYPDVRQRAQYLIDFSSQSGWKLPTDFAAVFREANGLPEFEIVDKMIENLYPLVIDTAKIMLSNFAADELYSHPETQAVLQDFSRAIPCRSSVRVSSIINAGYLLRDGHADWSPEVQVPTEERQLLLADLVFKSLEMIQFRRHAENQSSP